MLNTIFTKTSIAAALLSLMLGSAQAGTTPSNSTWQIVAPQGAGFSILMPGTPKAENDTMTIDNQKLEVVSCTYKTADEHENYFAGYIAAPTDEGLNKILDSIRSQISNGKVLWHQTASLNGHEGQKLATLKDGKVTIGEYFVVGRRIYIAAFETDNVVAAALNAAPFLGSFQLTQ